MSRALLFQIIKQTLINLAVHLLYERRFFVIGTSSPRDTQLSFDMSFITMLYPCHVTEVVYHRGGGAASHKIEIKTLHIFIKKCNERHTNLVE